MTIIYLIKLAAIFVVICLIGLMLYLDNNLLNISYYKIQDLKIPKEFNNYKILQLSDLHSKVFGKKEIKLVKKVEKANPNIIVITGDMVNDDGNYEPLLEIVLQLIKKYKVYYIVGNHEQNVQVKDSEKFNTMIDNLNKIGVKILSNEKITIKYKSSNINLYGMYFDLKYYRNMRKKEEKNINFEVSEMNSIIGKCNDKVYKILLSHNPLFFYTYCKWGADLILAGHVHGGIVRLPFLGGLFSPEHVFFPKYYEGLYTYKGKKMIVSRGLGRGDFFIRIFNRPEINVITLCN